MIMDALASQASGRHTPIPKNSGPLYGRQKHPIICYLLSLTNESDFVRD